MEDSPALKEFSAMVPRSEYDRFISRFPQHGSIKWFIWNALKTFNDRMEVEPSVAEIVHDSIDNMIREAKTT